MVDVFLPAQAVPTPLIDKWGRLAGAMQRRVVTVNKFIKNISAMALAAGVAALPGAANAGTSTATGTANFNVVSQCAITGSNVHLGTFTASQKWSDIANELGYWSGSAYTVGQRGTEYIQWGSVTCDTGVGYTVKITGSGPNIILNINGKSGGFNGRIKKIGTVTLADSAGALLPNTGVSMSLGTAAGTGTGAAQPIVGSVILSYAGGDGTTAQPGDVLTTAGTYSDTLNYTLTF